MNEKYAHIPNVKFDHCGDAYLLRDELTDEQAAILASADEKMAAAEAEYEAKHAQYLIDFAPKGNEPYDETLRGDKIALAHADEWNDFIMHQSPNQHMADILTSAELEIMQLILSGEWYLTIKDLIDDDE